IFRFGIENVPISDATLLNTIVGSLFALTTGFFFFRRLIDYPGTEGIAYAIPVFALTYGAASVIFLFLRLDYSRYVFGASYLLSVIWFTGISIAMTKLRTYRIGIVPGGDVLCLRSLPYAEWHVITDPGSIPIGLNAITADLRHSFTPEWERFVAEAAVSGTPVFDVKHLRETLTGRVQIAHLSENTLGALNPDDMYLKLKQALDWFAALVALVALAPFFAL